MNLGKDGRRWGREGRQEGGAVYSTLWGVGASGKMCWKRTESPVGKGHLTSKQAKGAPSLWAEGTTCPEALWYMGMWHVQEEPFWSCLRDEGGCRQRTVCFILKQRRKRLLEIYRHGCSRAL